MAAKVPWFERRFNFDFPLGWYPDLIERLRGTPARLEEKLRTKPRRPDAARASHHLVGPGERRTLAGSSKRSTTGGSRSS